jgi:hypothetical protein
MVKISIWRYDGGENREFMENFRVDRAGIRMLERLVIVTVWVVDSPVHVMPVFSVDDRLVHVIVGLMGSLRVTPETSSAQARLLGNLTVIYEPTGKLLVLTSVTTISPVLLTITGLNPTIAELNTSGVKLTAENGSLALLSIPIVAKNAEVVIAGDGFSTFEIIMVTSEIY